MTPIPGIIASQITGHLSPLTGFVSIATQTVVGSSTSSITFSSIPNSYKHLQIRVLARGNLSNYYDAVSFRYNGDNGANYFRHTILADGVNVPQSYGYANETKAFMGYIPGANANGNLYGPATIDILDYTNTSKYKTAFAKYGANNNTAGSAGYLYTGITSCAWANTSAINSINMFIDAGTFFAAGSTFALYGIQGA